MGRIDNEHGNLMTMHELQMNKSVENIPTAVRSSH